MSLIHRAIHLDIDSFGKVIPRFSNIYPNPGGFTYVRNLDHLVTLNALHDRKYISYTEYLDYRNNRLMRKIVKFLKSIKGAQYYRIHKVGIGPDVINPYASWLKHPNAWDAMSALSGNVIVTTSSDCTLD